MFTTPIRHTRLNNMEELLKFSYRTDGKTKPLTKWQNNGQIAFADAFGCVYVTPYRTEVHEILEKNGYTDKCFFVPFSNSGERPEAYKWLVQIAEEENWAETYEEALKVATEKGIKPVKLSQKFQLKEISYYDDKETNTIYSALTTQYLMNNSRENVGTYIIVDEKTIVICDEYGRTFLVRVKTVVNDLVNALIGAGYTRTAHPEYYIRHYTPVEDVEKQDLFSEKLKAIADS